MVVRSLGRLIGMVVLIVTTCGWQFLLFGYGTSTIKNFIFYIGIVAGAGGYWDLHQIELQNIGYVWILFSFIIALLILSFKQQVSLSTLIIANLSAAFAFGFGFDNVLKVAERYGLLPFN